MSGIGITTSKEKQKLSILRREKNRSQPVMDLNASFAMNPSSARAYFGELYHESCYREMIEKSKAKQMEGVKD
jgi:hypothetical protein